ncbi:hypothetical protein E7Z59_02065 [Robertkochia marina]|uniref:Copper chaperone NosL n=1 Tax=Robertkochia marina TaxID=1227945 RepID=A0A4S3M374_9FLAO|nr:nitrous oxide reductase accessory protein NosL [Robertkochia marina]THD69139.1 hypothetical protein E7Z59_02065 [Robertkochia marina]TRZ47602.1 hypothetical protein D3A96_02535 [Robertkochia marina]
MSGLRIAYSFLSIAMLFVLWGCSRGEPRPINYGSDGCHYCKMTIVDKIHGAELITGKGKIYTFDALECLIHYLKESELKDGDQYLTNVYEAPESLVGVEHSVFLISENMPSPMGANLTAFQSAEKAKELQEKKQGTLFSWEELLEKQLHPVGPEPKSY